MSTVCTPRGLSGQSGGTTLATEGPKKVNRKGAPNHPIAFRREIAKLRYGSRSYGSSDGHSSTEAQASVPHARGTAGPRHEKRSQRRSWII